MTDGKSFMMAKSQQIRYESLVNAVKDLSKISNGFSECISGNINLRLVADLNGHAAYYQRINYRDGQHDRIELTNDEISRKVIGIKSTKLHDSLKVVKVNYIEDLLTDREINTITAAIKKITQNKKIIITEKRIKDGEQETLY